MGPRDAETSGGNDLEGGRGDFIGPASSVAKTLRDTSGDLPDQVTDGNWSSITQPWPAPGELQSSSRSKILCVEGLLPGIQEGYLKDLFARRLGYKRLALVENKCLIEFEDERFAARTLTDLYGRGFARLRQDQPGVRFSFINGTNLPTPTASRSHSWSPTSRSRDAEASIPGGWGEAGRASRSSTSIHMDFPRRSNSERRTSGQAKNSNQSLRIPQSTPNADLKSKNITTPGPPSTATAGSITSRNQKEDRSRTRINAPGPAVLLDPIAYMSASHVQKEAHHDVTKTDATRTEMSDIWLRRNETLLARAHDSRSMLIHWLVNTYTTGDHVRKRRNFKPRLSTAPVPAHEQAIMDRSSSRDQQSSVARNGLASQQLSTTFRNDIDPILVGSQHDDDGLWGVQPGQTLIWQAGQWFNEQALKDVPPSLGDVLPEILVSHWEDVTDETPGVDDWSFGSDDSDSSVMNYLWIGEDSTSANRTLDPTWTTPRSDYGDMPDVDQEKTDVEGTHVSHPRARRSTGWVVSNDDNDQRMSSDGDWTDISEERSTDAAPHDVSEVLSARGDASYAVKIYPFMLPSDQLRTLVPDGIWSYAVSRVETVVALITRIARPKCVAHLSRIEWTCSCGKAIYGDYAGTHLPEFASNLPDGAVKCTTYSLQALLNRNRIWHFWHSLMSTIVLHGLFSTYSHGPDTFTSNVTLRLAILGCLVLIASNVSTINTIPPFALEQESAIYNLPGKITTIPWAPTSHPTGDSTTTNINPISNTTQSANQSAGQSTAQNSVQNSAQNATTPAGQPNVGVTISSASQQPNNYASNAMFFELCVNCGTHQISLCEIQITDLHGRRLIENDVALFSQIKRRYEACKGYGLGRLLYKPRDIHFVHFGVLRAGFHTGIYEKPLSIPPAIEVQEKRYHYYECPLKPLPPIDRRTFFHYFWDHDKHPPPGRNLIFESLFTSRLPKKLGDSIFNQREPKLQLGWGVHIIEGPNKPVLAWLATAIIVLSFGVSLGYDIGFKNKDSGFAIGSWMVTVLGTMLMALYFHLKEAA